MKAGLIAGVTAAIATNSLEAITVAKQTDPDRCIKSMIKEEKSGLLTKGLAPRVCLMGL